MAVFQTDRLDDDNPLVRVPAGGVFFCPREGRAVGMEDITGAGSGKRSPFGSLMLLGPGPRGLEEEHAAYIRQALDHYDKRSIGEPKRHDGLDGLAVDFTFAQSDPPIAMEVTAIVEDMTMAGGYQLRKLQERLDTVAREEQLGEWMFGIRTDARLKQIEPLLVRLMREAKERRELESFGLDRVPDNLDEPLAKLVGELLDQGMRAALHKSDDPDVHGVAAPILPVGNWLGGGFQDRLIACIHANAAKLREARPREGHLVVAIGMPGLSCDPCATPPPPLEDGVDVLWVILGYYNAKYDFRLWRTTAADPRWQLMCHGLVDPSEQPVFADCP